MVHVQHPTRLPVYTAPGQLLLELWQPGPPERKEVGDSSFTIQPHFPGFFLPCWDPRRVQGWILGSREQRRTELL